VTPETRRNWLTANTLKMGTVLGLSGLAQTSEPLQKMVHGSDQVRPETPQQALKWLMDGNQRFMAWRAGYDSMQMAPESALSVCSASYPENFDNPQDPVAIILTCSDSRDIPELIFDQGFGDLFVTRTAGNTVSPIVLGTIEYSAVELGTKLLVVMGHTGCGAVTAAVESVRYRTVPPGWIKNAVQPIMPAARQTVREYPRATESEQVFKAVLNNVLQVRNTIQTQSPTLNQLTRAGQFQVVGAYYELQTGKVVVIS
jgi:carbonic anhydrase